MYFRPRVAAGMQGSGRPQVHPRVGSQGGRALAVAVAAPQGPGRGRGEGPRVPRATPPLGMDGRGLSLTACRCVSRSCRSEIPGTGK